MKTIIIHESDFDINDENSIKKFNYKLHRITEPFEVTFDYPITEIPSWLFFNTRLSNIKIPDSVTEIKKSAFSNCIYLKEIILPHFITKIGEYAFARCKHLKEITLPNSIAEINEGLFFDCSSLAEITLPDSVTKIDFRTFKNCTSLKEIVIPMSKEKFLSNVEGAQEFYNIYKDIISFKDRTLDILLLENDSIESIINNIDQER